MLSAGDEVAYLAYHDVLTGLANRAGLLEGLGEALSEAERDGHAVALLYLDLDDFKLINDGLGHATGDEVLRIVARRLEQAVRYGDLIARHGGDEFLIVLHDLPADGGDRGTAERRAVAVCERIAAVLDEPLELGGADLHLRSSVGVCLYPFDAGDVDTLLRRADTAMYEAKSAGGGYALFHRDAPDPLAHLSLAGRLRRAIREGELVVHYQPVFRLPDCTPLGVEALVRWRQPDGTLLAPDAFLPIAERTGLVAALGDEVAEQVCRQLVAWEQLSLVPRMGINVSPRELRQGEFAERFLERVERHGVEPGRFVIELTESTWTIDAARTLPVLDRLRGAGVYLGLDDFGAGYSSLARLRRLPFDVLKIDRAFLEGVPEDPQATAIVTAILQLAHACECDVVAEGVENGAQLSFLIQSGCQLAQGYLLGRPGPADAVTTVLQRSLTPDRRR